MAELEQQIIAAGQAQEQLPKIAGGSGLSKSALRRREATHQALADTLDRIKSFDPSSLLPGESRTYKQQYMRR